jgi:hypothetical protein
MEFPIEKGPEQIQTLIVHNFLQLHLCLSSIGLGAWLISVFPQQVNFIVAACENMISGGGMRPGDILTASNGKTIEVCVVGGSRSCELLKR